MSEAQPRQPQVTARIKPPDKGIALRSKNTEARLYLRQHLTATKDGTAVDGMLLQEIHGVRDKVADISVDQEAIAKLVERVDLLEQALAKLVQLPGIAMQLKRPEQQEVSDAPSTKGRRGKRR